MDPALSTGKIALAAGGAVSALGLGLHRLEEAACSNLGAVRECPRLAGKGYQSTRVGSVPDEVWALLRDRDPEHAETPAFLLADAALRETLHGLEAGAPNPGSTSMAGGSESSLPPPARRGLVLSTTKAEITALERGLSGSPCPALTRRHLFPALLAEDLAAAHGIAGPVQCVSAACISGLLAIQQGVLLIQEGRADLVLVVGVDLLSAFVLTGFTTLKSLEPEGCRPFDVDRRGLSLGEGAGAVALLRRERVAAPVLSVTGWGSSNDANHLTGPSRDGSGLALAIQRALARAGTPPEAIDFVHTHGTGTPYNDAMEALALRTVFPARVPPFCSSKGLIGHTLGAAGLLETLLCLAAARHQMLPGTPGLTTPDPAMPHSLLRTPRPAESLRHILKLNSGFGGTNAGLVLEWEEA